MPRAAGDAICLVLPDVSRRCRDRTATRTKGRGEDYDLGSRCFYRGTSMNDVGCFRFKCVGSGLWLKVDSTYGYMQCPTQTSNTPNNLYPLTVPAMGSQAAYTVQCPL